MTDKTKKAFEELWLEVLRFRDSQCKIQNLCEEAIVSLVEKDGRASAKNVLKASLEPLYEYREKKLYDAAKKFVETYEANDLA